MNCFSIALLSLSSLLFGCGSDSDSDPDNQMTVDTQVVVSGLLPLPGRGNGQSFRVIKTQAEIDEVLASVSTQSNHSFNFANSTYVLYLRGENDISPCTAKINYKGVNGYVSDDGSLVVSPRLQQECPNTDPDVACNAIFIAEYPYYLIELNAKSESIVFKEEKLKSCG